MKFEIREYSADDLQELVLTIFNDQKPFFICSHNYALGGDVDLLDDLVDLAKGNTLNERLPHRMIYDRGVIIMDSQGVYLKDWGPLAKKYLSSMTLGFARELIKKAGQ